MFKSILAVSEGGPDAAMSFKLAARVAGIFDGTVDALHLPVGPAGGIAGGLAMSGEAMPLIMDLDDERLGERATESERAYKEIVAPVKDATYTAAKTATLDTLVAMGRCADLLVLGRPGADPENVAPATVEAAVHECARSVMIAPPNAGEGPFGSVIVAWNGSFQAARAVEYSLPFLAKASLITILVVGSTPDDVGAPYLAQSRPTWTQDHNRRHRSRRRVGPRPRPRVAGLHPRQGRRPPGDGRLRSRPGAELPGLRRRHRQGDLVLPRAAVDGALGSARGAQSVSPILSSIDASPSSRLAALSLPSRKAICSVSRRCVPLPPNEGAGASSIVVSDTEIGVPRLVIE